MTIDVRIRVDQFFASNKTLEGSWSWYESERVNTSKYRRAIAEDGVLRGFRLEVNAHIGMNPHEFRFLIIGLNECVFRMDCAPTIDGEHINGPSRPMGLPFAISGHHFHPWQENRSFSTPRALSGKLPYAIDSPSKITTIQQGFWVFCNLIGLAATSADEPEWPTKQGLL